MHQLQRLPAAIVRPRQPAFQPKPSASALFKTWMSKLHADTSLVYKHNAARAQTLLLEGVRRGLKDLKGVVKGNTVIFADGSTYSLQPQTRRIIELTPVTPTLRP